MAAPNADGLQALLSTLQNSFETKIILSIINLLDELLSAGTDRRVHYLISKGGSEALLQAFVNTASSISPDYNVLLPLLHLLAKVGHRDRKVGEKAEKVGAVLLTLSLLKQNVEHARRAAACLWVLRVFCSSASAAALLGENQCLDAVFKLISPNATKNTRTVKAAVDAFAGLLRSKANGRRAAAKGYVSGLLRLYEDWHHREVDHTRVTICRALLHCLNQAINTSAANAALLADGGLGLLFRTTQACLDNEKLLPLVEPAVQLMRKCYPKSSIPITSEWSTHVFPLPSGSPMARNTVPETQDEDLEEDNEDDNESSNDHMLLRRMLVLILSGNNPNGHKSEEGAQETPTEVSSTLPPLLVSLGDRKDDDQEINLDKLRAQSEPDRPCDQLGQYARLCSELHHDFQDLDSRSERKASADGQDPVANGCNFEAEKCNIFRPESCLNEERTLRSLCVLQESQTPHEGSEKLCFLNEPPQASGFHGSCLRKHDMVAKLLEKYRTHPPHHSLYSVPHDSHIYTGAAATRTKSVAGYSVMAFPDYWGHLPPQIQEPMVVRQPNIQRKKIFEDIQRFICPDELINKIVFDLEDPSPQASDLSNSLQFFSGFESGNLRKAIRVRRNEYDLILNSDVNSSENHQWFYFEVSGMESAVCYRFNIINCEKANSQFNYGMQPVLFSVREALEGRPYWVRIGSEICYYRNHYCPFQGPRGSSYYTLTFSMIFKHSEDVCYLAYHYPYTYSALQNHLKILQESVDSRKIFFQQQTLCSTIGGNSCPVVTITACPTSHSWTHLHQLHNRPYVVLTARVHPGESNASWVMKGSLEFLCSDDPVAEALREIYIFKIIPMLNPDGVVNGSSRCALSGEDLNRQWKKPDPNLSPTIYHAKGLLSYLSSTGRSPLVFCDYHGHSRKKNVFLYGCSVKETLWYSGSVINTATLKEDTGYHTIAKVLSQLAPAFSLNSCSYVVEKSRESTARVVVWREMGVHRSYTMESTYNGCNQGIYKDMQLGTRELEEMGAHFCASLLSLRRNSVLCNAKLMHHATALLDLEVNPPDHSSQKSFEDDEPPCSETIEYCGNYYLKHSGDELDSEINDNVSSSEEEDEKDEEDDNDDDKEIDCLIRHCSVVNDNSCPEQNKGKTFPPPLPCNRNIEVAYTCMSDNSWTQLTSLLSRVYPILK
ncbi:cytosolic carboxypeptidase 4 [Scleropages formosus]|uniref:cytosolic carboxypeptidase 4 n=1 Tax=Scleropages formosus TaxID=113540 RepID=UPI0010FA9764|nr:cytosolic carboxypeptidase 4-like [Scleropages formosus]